MPTYLKRGLDEKRQKQDNHHVRHAVEEIIREVEQDGDAAVRKFSWRFDRWIPQDFRLSPRQIQEITAQVPRHMLDDIQFSQEQVRRFAEEQKKTLLDLEVETLPGVTLGHRIIPVESVGCYIPGGIYPLLSSAAMNIIPAKVAGCRRVIACTPPSQGNLPALSIAAMSMAGADEIHIIGGVQAIAAMAVGTDTVKPVSMIVGPGNAYVAEAKRQVFGRVGIDMIAGPSEVLVIADASTDVEIAAADLIGQAEHGVNSPCTLLTTSQEFAVQVIREIEKQLAVLPTVKTARASWDDYGEVIIAIDEGEIVSIANQLAYEHIEVLTENPDFYLHQLENYGSLFLGMETNVPYGDFVIGTNHTLPTNGAARYTGGLWVGKFLKTVTYQKCTPRASAMIGEYCSRLAEMEGCYGHKLEADLRVRRYGTA